MSKYQGGVDPIEQLKNAYNNKLEKKVKIKLKGNDLFFDKEIRLNLKSETAWLSPSTSKQYNLGSLWLFMEYHTKAIQSKNAYI